MSHPKKNNNIGPSNTMSPYNKTTLRFGKNTYKKNN